MFAYACGVMVNTAGSSPADRGSNPRGYAIVLNRFKAEGIDTSMKIVFATKTVNVGVDGNTWSVIYGTHWAASDPVVQKYPDLFSDDPRYGLFATVPVEEEVVKEESDEPEVKPSRGPGRPKSRA